jgi:hypothetical protein
MNKITNNIKILIVILFAIIIILGSKKNSYAEIVIYTDNSIEDLWHKYINKEAYETNNLDFIVIGDINNEINDLINYDWKYKNLTYQLYYDNQLELANDIYYLAIFVNDITQDVSLARFQKGVQGFHYGINQICDWLNSLESRNNNLYSYLLKGNVIKDENGKIVPTGKFNHILGVAYNKKREMMSIVKHEIIHILWDENKAIRDYYILKWNKSSEQDKENIINSLKGYSKENTDQIIEEWAVREIEKNL